MGALQSAIPSIRYSPDAQIALDCVHADKDGGRLRVSFRAGHPNRVGSYVSQLRPSEIDNGIGVLVIGWVVDLIVHLLENRKPVDDPA